MLYYALSGSIGFGPVMEIIVENVCFCNATHVCNWVLLLMLISGGSRISPRRGRQLPSGGRGAPTYVFAKFSQKLHEIERIWTRGGEARVQNFTM